MITRGWKIIVVLSTLTILQLSKCEGTISGVFQSQGFRGYMEDSYIQIENSLGTGIGIFGVFDGHTGDFSSNFAAGFFTKVIENEIMLYSSGSRKCVYADRQHKTLNFERMLKDFTLQAENHLTTATTKQLHTSGTTCLIVIAEKRKLTVANVGDSRGVMCNQNGIAVDLSFDHKPDRADEKQRIENAGETIYESGVWRVRGLAMSRSLGDSLKKGNDNVIIATPDVLTFDLNQHKPQFMILASDGLWDVMSSQDAVNFIKERYMSSPDFGARDLVIQALTQESTDNITVVIVVFRNGRFEVASA